MKRAVPTSDAPNKRLKTHRHKLQHAQQWELNPLLATQDETFFRAQLLRAVTMAVAAAGFDTAKPSALEQLLAMTENCKCLTFRLRLIN
jgi:transcription initiation factor TFIID subunit 8